MGKKVAPEEDYQRDKGKEEQHGSPATSMRYGENCTVSLEGAPGLLLEYRPTGF